MPAFKIEHSSSYHPQRQNTFILAILLLILIQQVYPKSIRYPPTMGGNHFLKLIPEEGRPHVFKATGDADQKSEGQNPSLRRVSGIADLKTDANKDAAPLPKFLKLTPDPPTNTGSNTGEKPNLQLGPGEPARKSSA
jgi:hypothetical protein